MQFEISDPKITIPILRSNLRVSLILPSLNSKFGILDPTQARIRNLM